MQYYVLARERTVRRRYKRKLREFALKPERLEQLQKDYDLVQRVLTLCQSKTTTDIAKTLNLNQSTIRDWISGRKFPRSLRLNHGKKKIKKSYLEASEEFAYLLGAYQPRVERISRKSIEFQGQDSILEQKIQKCVYKLFGVQRQKYCSSELMRYIIRLTKDNTRLPKAVLSSRAKKERYIAGLLDSSASINSYNHKIKSSHVERKKPSISIFIRNPCLIYRIKDLLHEHNIKANIVTDKRDGKKCLSIIEFESLKNCLEYITHQEKYGKLHYLITYASEVKRFDFNGKYGRELKKYKEEKEKNRVPVDDAPLRAYRTGISVN